MGETHHDHHDHSHTPPPIGVPPMSVGLGGPLSGPRGATFVPEEQLHQLTFCIHSNPSWPEMFLLAFQHYIVTLGTTVMIASFLVPRMGGDHGDKARVIQTLLFMGAINTLLQTFLGTRLPTVMGSSFAFVIPVTAIIRDFSDSGFNSEHDRFVHTMRAIQGALIVSSFFNIIIGYSKAWGAYSRLFSPVSIVPVVCVVGLGLFQRGFPWYSFYLKRLHESTYVILERFALLMCVGVVWAFAALLTVSGAYNDVGEQTKTNCRLINPTFLPYPFQWGPPIFRASHVFGMMGAALVTSAESTGTYFAAARLSGAAPPPAHVLTKHWSAGNYLLFQQGVGMLLNGIFEQHRRVVQLSCIFMLFFSIFGKFGAFFASIPLPIFAAIYCVLFDSLVTATGISLIQFANNNSMRNLYFNDIINTIFSSPPTVALIVGTLLDNTLDARRYVEDRGLGWWIPFQHRKWRYEK
ncbi:hypothetical protein MKW92_043703 [Papaver armeniacum]|nr:hypothetical protein MKW92_043703 [Papaver armeniacum]